MLRFESRPSARRARRLGVVACAALVGTATPCLADLFGRTAHGGRGVGQAGAFAARADDAAAVRTNPAGTARLARSTFQFALDFDAPTDESEREGVKVRAEHMIQFPPAAYYVWKAPDPRLAIGVGLDAPLWRLIDWEPVDFPDRFVSRSDDTRLFELRVTGAWALDESWSVGAAGRIVRGTLGYGDSAATELHWDTESAPIEVLRTASATGDGVGWELSTQFRRDRWGFGATLASAVDVDGSGDLEYLVRDAAGLPEAARGAARERFRADRTTIAQSIPERWTLGCWWSPFSRVTLELDGELARWSAVRTPGATHDPATLDAPFSLSRRDDWDDTVAWRLGAEWDPDGPWTFGGGFALEPSPVGAIEPGAPRGDAKVVALGASWSLPKLTFDLGASYHAFEEKSLLDRASGARTIYSGRALVWSVGARFVYD